MKRHIEYVKVSTLAERANPANPKDHDLGLIHTSVDRFGFVEPVVLDERTGLLVSGHGRVETMAQKEGSGPAPEGIEVDDDGNWLMPVTRGWSSKDDAEAEAFLIAANQLTVAGGWKDDGLLDVLARLDSGPGLEGLGFDGDDIDELMRRIHGDGKHIPPDDFGEIDPDELNTEYRCPSCGYEWSGKAAP